MSQPLSLVECLLQHAELAPERPAIASRRHRISYGDLAQLVLAQARALGDEGVGESSVVGVEGGGDLEQLILCLATVHLGATSCSLPSRGSAQGRENLLKSMGVTHVRSTDLCQAQEMVHRGERPPVGAGRAGPEGNHLFSTSGTTGEPKIVRHSGSNLVLQAPRHIGSSDERFGCLATMEHNFVKRHRLYCVAQGATNVFLDATPTLIVEQCRDLELSTLHVSAFQAQELLALPNLEALPPIRLKLGGSHVPASLRQSLRECISADLHCGYGTTETGAIAFSDPADGEGSGETVGRALAGIEIRVADAKGQSVGAGESGEIAIRCEGMFDGYLQQTEETAARLVDGWFSTGDVGSLDEQGRLFLSGRSDDMFVFNSMNIYPQEIEAQICRSPAVLDAAVLAKASPVHGDIPVAIVVLEDRDTADMRSLRQFVRSHVGARTPRQFFSVDEIPRNAAGKILRPEALALLDRVQSREA